MQNYIRVESVINETEESVGGYISVLLTLLFVLLDAEPNCSAEELAEKVYKSNDPKVKELYCASMILENLPIPQIYEEDKENLYCLYTEDQFNEDVYELQGISELLEEVSHGKYSLRCKSFEIEDDEILYSDPYQIVISKETYDKYNDESLPMILDAYIDFMEMFQEFDDDIED